MKMNRSIILTAGHSDGSGPYKDRGCQSYDGRLFEGNLTIELRDMVSKRLKEKGHTVYTDSNKNPLAQAMQELKGFFNINSLNVDIHFNAGHISAEGTECLVKDNPDAYVKKVAEVLSQKISMAMETKNRGVKTESMSARKRLGWMRMTGNNIIIEICFLSNKMDVHKYEQKKVQVAEAIAEVLSYYARV
jgi:N-acetylmuramoyl-L-alanine amidase